VEKLVGRKERLKSEALGINEKMCRIYSDPEILNPCGKPISRVVKKSAVMMKWNIFVLGLPFRFSGHGS